MPDDPVSTALDVLGQARRHLGEQAWENVAGECRLRALELQAQRDGAAHHVMSEWHIGCDGVSGQRKVRVVGRDDHQYLYDDGWGPCVSISRERAAELLGEK